MFCRAQLFEGLLRGSESGGPLVGSRLKFRSLSVVGKTQLISSNAC